MSQPFLGEIRLFSFDFAPQGWAACNGQLALISQNMALFSKIGTTYGGDGQNNFALPDLRGRMPVHKGNGHNLGEKAGQAAHTLTIQEMPTHTHLAQGNNAAASDSDPAGHFWANGGDNVYFAGQSPSPLVAMRAGTVANAGGSQPHNNMSPFLAVNFCIALQGVFS